jgi:hypothetical protein
MKEKLVSILFWVLVGIAISAIGASAFLGITYGNVDLATIILEGGVEIVMVMAAIACRTTPTDEAQRNQWWWIIAGVVMPTTFALLTWGIYLNSVTQGGMV